MSYLESREAITKVIRLAVCPDAFLLLVTPSNKLCKKKKEPIKLLWTVLNIDNFK